MRLLMHWLVINMVITMCGEERQWKLAVLVTEQVLMKLIDQLYNISIQQFVQSVVKHITPIEERSIEPLVGVQPQEHSIQVWSYFIHSTIKP